MPETKEKSGKNNKEFVMIVVLDLVKIKPGPAKSNGPHAICSNTKRTDNDSAKLLPLLTRFLA